MAASLVRVPLTHAGPAWTGMFSPTAINVAERPV